MHIPHLDKVSVGLVMLNIIVFVAAPFSFGLLFFVILADLIILLELYVKRFVKEPERKVLSDEKLQTKRYKRF